MCAAEGAGWCARVRVGLHKGIPAQPLPSHCNATCWLATQPWQGVPALPDAGTANNAQADKLDNTAHVLVHETSGHRGRFDEYCKKQGAREELVEPDAELNQARHSRRRHSRRNCTGGGGVSVQCRQLLCAWRGFLRWLLPHGPCTALL